jgi:hypothetical protein
MQIEEGSENNGKKRNKFISLKLKFSQTKKSKLKLDIFLIFA